MMANHDTIGYPFLHLHRPQTTPRLLDAMVQRCRHSLRVSYAKREEGSGHPRHNKSGRVHLYSVQEVTVRVSLSAMHADTNKTTLLV